MPSSSTDGPDTSTPEDDISHRLITMELSTPSSAANSCLIVNSPTDFEGNHKFSTLLTSKIMSIVVGKDQHIFHVHTSLLCSSSDYFKTILSGAGEAVKQLAVAFPDIEPDIFGYFVSYLYRDKWETLSRMKLSKQYIDLAKMYSLGSQLQASDFQKIVLREFDDINMADLSPQRLMELLEIAVATIPEQQPEDCLRDYIFAIASRRMEDLQSHKMFFERLLKKYPDVGRQLCLRARSSITALPNLPWETPSLRFLDESFSPSDPVMPAKRSVMSSLSSPLSPKKTWRVVSSPPRSRHINAVRKQGLQNPILTAASLNGSARSNDSPLLIGKSCRDQSSSRDSPGSKGAVAQHHSRSSSLQLENSVSNVEARPASVIGSTPVEFRLGSKDNYVSTPPNWPLGRHAKRVEVAERMRADLKASPSGD